VQILATTYAAAAGVGLLLGVIHLMVLTRLKDRPEHLFAALMGLSAGVMALSEASYLGEPSLQGYRIAMEVQNVSVAVMLISMTWFARLRFKAGRSWLAWSITALWTTLATISVLGPGNIAFLSIDGLTTMTTAWGETYAVPYGRIHPLKVLTDLTSLAIVLFVVDASLSAARSGRRRAALGVGGPILFFIVVAGVHTPLVDAGYLETPYLISLVFVAITLSLALGLVDEVAEAAVLSKQLRLQR